MPRPQTRPQTQPQARARARRNRGRLIPTFTEPAQGDLSMTAQSRRRFLIQSSRLGAAALIPAWGWRRALANPLGRPIGIQLYTVNTPMQEDAAGTLKKLRAIGFGEVE